MTAIYSIFVRLTPTKPVAAPPVAPKAVVAVVPAFNDQPGLSQTLASLDHLGMAQIVVVDDGSVVPMELPPATNTPVKLIRHPVNRGAAAARNSGLAIVEADWVYFTDCGCIHDEGLLLAFARKRAESRDCTVAIVGPVEALGDGRLAHYYTHQGILNAPMLERTAGKFEVETIVTANALVNRRAIEAIGGFDEAFPSAGGEDTDLGIRLRSVGYIEWCASAKVFHSFKECLADFDNRMHRYGRGMRIVSEKLGVDLRPRPFRPFDLAYMDLADRQYREMLDGFGDEPVAALPQIELLATHPL